VYLFVCCVWAAGAVDSDGDGLCDFQEVHKYLTDPAKADSDGDGTPDGDWDERREYAYSVRSIIQFMPPFDKAALNDDFQDARVLEAREDYIELEVIHYPLATAGKVIEADPNWQTDYAKMTEYLKPGITANWDVKMRETLLAELQADGIDVDQLTDKQVVEQVSAWIMKKSKSLGDVFTTYYIHYLNARPSVYPDLEGAFQREFNKIKDSCGWPINQHFGHELLGRGMFYNKTYGTCTSFAVYLTTVLRAVGIPTRMIIVIPAVDPSDEQQLRLVGERIAHNRVRETSLAGLRKSGQGFIAHTFNEVYVGNRWHRLNYSKLGQPVLDSGLFGLHTHLYTFRDLSEANLAPTWGRRYAKGERSAVFKGSNPYAAIVISDRFGRHGNVPNPPVPEHSSRTISDSCPNIYVMYPPSLEGWWEGFVGIVGNVTANKTGRSHEKKFYDQVFVDDIWGRKAGDIVVLLFSLDTKDRIPAKYANLLLRPWAEIEAALKEGKNVELEGKARDMNVILLAAPRRDQLKQLIGQTKLLENLERYAQEKSEPSPGDETSGKVVGIGPAWQVLKEVVGDRHRGTFSHHNHNYYSKALSWAKGGDTFVLMFAFGQPSQRVPEGYQNLLPRPWHEIEGRLRRGEVLELEGAARGLNIVLLAAPTLVRLEQLVRETELLRPPDR
jgi:hypothetical protein